MSERIEYARKVVSISLCRINKHPTHDVNELNNDDKERLINMVMDTMLYDVNQINYAFNCISMNNVIDPTYRYCYKDYVFENYDDDLTIYTYLKEFKKNT